MAKGNPGRGGPQPGAGRPKGAATVKTRIVANHIAKSGEPLPLEVMIDNMLFWHQEAKKFEQQLMSVLSRNLDQATAETAKEVATALNQVIACRDKSQACAVDAAPYIHAKLASIHYREEAEANPLAAGSVDLAGLSDDELARRYREALNASVSNGDRSG